MGNCGSKDDTIPPKPIPSSTPLPTKVENVALVKKINETQPPQQTKEDLGDLPVLTSSQLAAVTKIQRIVRNRSAWRIAQAEREWKVRYFAFLYSKLLRYLVTWIHKMKLIC